MKRKSGAVLLVGNSVDCPDLEYATGFRAADPVVFLWARGKVYLVVPELELGRAKRSKADVVLTPRDLKVRGVRGRRPSEWVIGLLERTRVRRVTVSGRFPYGVARRIERWGGTLHVRQGMLFPERAVKTKGEINKLRQAQQAAVLGMRAATAMIAESEIGNDGWLETAGKRLTAEAVKKTIRRVLLAHDCVGRRTIVAGGGQGADPHEEGYGALHAWEPIVMDIFPQHVEHGYWGDLSRTVAKGQPPPEVKKAYRAVKAAQNAALSVVKPGVMCCTVHGKAVAEFERRGFRTERIAGRSTGFIHSTGHGVGLAVHEAPGVGPGRERLRAGNVITIEPGLYYPEMGGIRVEDTIVVVKSGWRHLVPCETKLVL